MSSGLKQARKVSAIPVECAAGNRFPFDEEMGEQCDQPRGPWPWLAKPGRTTEAPTTIIRKYDVPKMVEVASRESGMVLVGLLKSIAGAYNILPDISQETGTVALQQCLGSLGRIESRLEDLTGRINALQYIMGSRIFSISTFAPEPYDLSHPMQVTVYPVEDGFCASFLDANLQATGDTEEESVSNLKSLLLDTFDSLSSEKPQTLGPEPLKQLRVLSEFILPRA